jgi:hypothetical protein
MMCFCGHRFVVVYENANLQVMFHKFCSTGQIFLKRANAHTHYKDRRRWKGIWSLNASFANKERKNDNPSYDVARYAHILYSAIYAQSMCSTSQLANEDADSTIFWTNSTASQTSFCHQRAHWAHHPRCQRLQPPSFLHHMDRELSYRVESTCFFAHIMLDGRWYTICNKIIIRSH